MIGELLAGSGALTLLERVIGTGGIIAYHSVTREPFLPSVHVTGHSLAAQLEFLTARYRVVPLRDLIDRRRTGRSVRGCVAVTFDDAYVSVLDVALPLLERYGVPATVFVPTSYCRTGSRFWWDRLGWVTARGGPFVAERALRAACGVPAGTHEEVLAAMVASRAGRLDAGTEAELSAAEHQTGAVPERSLSESELGILAHAALIDFGCHTQTHPALPLLSFAEQRSEIANSYHWLRDRLPRVHRYLAYPFGLYERSTVKAACDAGMDAAFSMEGRAAGPRFDTFTCPRIGVAEVNTLRGLRLRLGWFSVPMLIWRHGGRHPHVPRTVRALPMEA